MTASSTQNTLSTRILKYWLPVMAMLGAMYYFSTDVFSGENTRSIVDIVLTHLIRQPSSRLIARANYFVRKSAHFTEYAVLAALLFRAFRADSEFRWRARWFVYSIAIVVSWSLLDEFHQTFTRKRGGSIYDSMLDISGGLFALLIVWLLSSRKGKVREA